MPNLKVGETAPSMDSAEQSLIDRIWTAIDAKDWETARSLLERWHQCYAGQPQPTPVMQTC
jgi:hypothetical protein